MLKRRQFSHAVAAGLFAPAIAVSTRARAKPYTGPVRVLVGFPPGGATDVVARSIVERLSRANDGKTYFVDNKPGAGGQIAAQFLKTAPADGSTVMLSIDHTQVIIPLTIAAANYDPVADFTALSGVARYYNVLSVGPGAKARSMEELGTWLKANPNEANFGVPAAGSVPQFIAYMVGKQYGVPANVVPYKGGAPLTQDLLGGQVPIAISSLTEVIDHHRAGKVRTLACSGDVRSKTAPEIPTFKELGFPGIDNPWLAFFGPKGMPEDVTASFDQSVKEVLAQPDIQERLAKLGNEVAAVPGKEVRQWVLDGTRHWGQVIKDAGFKPQ